MSRPLAPFILAAALAAASFPLTPPASATASADTPVPALPRAAPEPLPRWGRPPEAVRNAQAALRDACAAWPKLIPLGSEPPAARLAQADQQYVSGCNLVLDPEGTGQLSLLQGGALGATVTSLPPGPGPPGGAAGHSGIVRTSGPACPAAGGGETAGPPAWSRAP